MKHNRDTYPYQGKSDRQVKFSQDVNYCLVWIALIALAVYYGLIQWL